VFHYNWLAWSTRPRQHPPRAPLAPRYQVQLGTSVHKIWKILDASPSRFPSVPPISASDASGEGLGGIHFIPNPDGLIQPFLWRQRIPQGLRSRLVTNINPTGNITIINLELAATVSYYDVLVHQVDIHEHTTTNLHDNTSAVYWQRKGSTTSTKAAAYILRLQALHHHFHRYIPWHDYLAGKMNAIADDCDEMKTKRDDAKHDLA
jgi:hypothetical protein